MHREKYSKIKTELKEIIIFTKIVLKKKFKDRKNSLKHRQGKKEKY